MIDQLSPLTAKALRFYELVEQFSGDAGAYAEIFHPDIELTEYPNAISPVTRVRTAEDRAKGIQAGRGMLAWHRFDIQKVTETADTVVLESVWTGEMAIDAGPLKKGQRMTAHVCCVIEFKDGLIFRTRNYDCYDPF
ncbi:nuclear transport factor 2 family protein [Larkinella soli]|uniref:nuclear transport factor 2 family protein n=1 Tax=Larkinella soli TaxID=1770527 RepID=UPI0013E32449|nr:nuclear transport factor 2 family protein [Larkinella soli]